jgi:small subunit ribosomal protein S20
MPNIKSAQKRMRQNTSRYRKNLSAKRAMRQAIKDSYDAIANHQQQQAREHAKTAQKAIDKAVKKGVIKKNTAARKKSRLNRQLEQAFASTTKTKSTSGKVQKQTAPVKKASSGSGSSSTSTSKSNSKKQSASNT